jgi:hypothetical protein
MKQNVLTGDQSVNLRSITSRENKKMLKAPGSIFRISASRLIVCNGVFVSVRYIGLLEVDANNKKPIKTIHGSQIHILKSHKEALPVF